MMAHQTKEPEAITDLNPDVPEELAAVVDRLMQKLPEKRYASTREVIEALEPLAGDLPAIKPLPRAAAVERRPGTAVIARGPGAALEKASPDRRPAPAGTRSELGRRPERPPPRSVPAPPAPAGRTAVPGSSAFDGQGPRTWEERLGPIGIAAIAILACAAAWLATWKLF